MVNIRNFLKITLLFVILLISKKSLFVNCDVEKLSSSTSELNPYIIENDINNVSKIIGKKLKVRNLDNYVLSPTSSSNNITKSGKFIPGCEPGTLSVCEKLQPISYGIGKGIPSSVVAIENACKVFNKGMDCYYSWAKKCIRKEDQMHKFNTSVLGAHEMYTFLCKDPVFRRGYLQHAECYKKISHRWDACAMRFIEVLQTITKEDSPNSICCLRLTFISCIMQFTHRKCDSTAARFIQQMAETLLRSRLQGHTPEHCLNFNQSACPELYTKAQSTNQIFIHSHLFTPSMIIFYILLT